MKKQELKQIIKEELKEAISKQAFIKMKGLMNLKEMKKFQSAAGILYDDLIDEGFNRVEIFDFLRAYIAYAVL